MIVANVEDFVFVQSLVEIVLRSAIIMNKLVPIVLALSLSACSYDGYIKHIHGDNHKSYVGHRLEETVKELVGPNIKFKAKVRGIDDYKFQIKYRYMEW